MQNYRLPKLHELFELEDTEYEVMIASPHNLFHEETKAKVELALMRYDLRSLELDRRAPMTEVSELFPHLQMIPVYYLKAVLGSLPPQGMDGLAHEIAAQISKDNRNIQVYQEGMEEDCGDDEECIEGNESFMAYDIGEHPDEVHMQDTGADKLVGQGRIDDLFAYMSKQKESELGNVVTENRFCVSHNTLKEMTKTPHRKGLYIIRGHKGTPIIESCVNTRPEGIDYIDNVDDALALLKENSSQSMLQSLETTEYETFVIKAIVSAANDAGLTIYDKGREKPYPAILVEDDHSAVEITFEYGDMMLKSLGAFIRALSSARTERYGISVNDPEMGTTTFYGGSRLTLTFKLH